MPRKPKALPMPADMWVAREPEPMEFLTWDVDPLMPKGETATRYVRHDIADALLASLRELADYAAPYLPRVPYNMENASKRILGAARNAIAKAEEGR